jgi:hypothetical protein
MSSSDTDSASEDDNPKKTARVKKSPAAKLNESSKLADDITKKQNYGYGRNQKMPVLVTDLYREIDLPELKEFNTDDIKIDSTIVEEIMDYLNEFPEYEKPKMLNRTVRRQRRITNTHAINRNLLVRHVRNEIKKS